MTRSSQLCSSELLLRHLGIKFRQTLPSVQHDGSAAVFPDAESCTKVSREPISTFPVPRSLLDTWLKRIAQSQEEQEGCRKDPGFSTVPAANPRALNFQLLRLFPKAGRFCFLKCSAYLVLIHCWKILDWINARQQGKRTMCI